MKKTLMLLAVFTSIIAYIFSKPISIPKIKTYEYEYGTYSIKIEFIKEFKQAVFSFYTSETIYKAYDAISKLEKEISLFVKVHGYKDYVTKKSEVKFFNGMAKYYRDIEFI